MKTINYTQYKKDFKNEKVTTVKICPYFEFEEWSAGTIHITDAIDEITTVNYRRKPSFTLIPDMGDIVDTLMPHYKLLSKLIRVDAPAISVFDTDGNKLAQLNRSVVKT